MNNDSRPTNVRSMVLAALSAAAAIAYVQRPLMGAAATVVRVEHRFTLPQMGVLLSSWLWSYAALQIPAGRLADLWGARRSLALYCAVWSLATMLLPFASSFELMCALGFVFGAAQAGIFPSAAIIVRQWFPPQNRGFATGCVAASQQVGGGLAAILGGFWVAAYLGLWQPEWMAAEKVPVPALPAWLGALSEDSSGIVRRLFHWSGMFVWFSVPGLIWSVWFLFWYRDNPDDHPAMNDGERALLPRDLSAKSVVAEGAAAPAREDNVWWAMLTSPTMWLISAQQFFRGFSYIFYVTWFPTYLKNARGLPVEKSGMITGLMFLAALLGALLGGGISDGILARTGSRRIAKQGMAFVSLVGAALFLASSYLVSSVTAAVTVLFIGSFMAALAGPIGYSVTIDISGRQTATVFGGMNMAGNIGAALFPIVVPFLLNVPERLGLSFSGWDLVLFVFAGTYLAAAACWILLNPNGTIFDEARGV